ncbi:MAG: hypothetical protein M0R80_07665 [Proteobacteria bacterium]|jgi:hypothetical protein|nr:hypothetical protein [Pseudomonadota bacterium]
MGLYLREDDFEVGEIVMVVEEPPAEYRNEYSIEGGNTVVAIPANTFYPEIVWKITGVDLPFVAIRPWNPQRRWSHLGTYVLDCRKYKFKKVTPEFAAAATEQPPQ